MKKKLLIIITLLLILFPFVKANNDGSIEHIWWDTVITYEWKSITVSNDVINANTQKCPVWYHLWSAEDWSNVIKMWRDIKWSQCEYMNLSETNSLYKINEQYEQWKDYNPCLYYFKEDLQINNIVTPREYWYYKTSSYGRQHKPYIFVYDGLSSTTISPIEHIQWYIWSVSIKTCDLTNDLPWKNPNWCRDIVNGRCFKDTESTIINNWYSKEYNDAYIFAFNNKITTMPTIEEANMNWEIIRAEIAKMLANRMKSLWYYVDPNIKCNFSDTSSVQWDLVPAIREICQLGVMWQWITKFRPFDKITKWEVATAVSRIIRWDKYNWWEPFYVNHINALIQEWVIDNSDNVNTNELRWNVMLMLMKANEVIEKNNASWPFDFLNE